MIWIRRSLFVLIAAYFGLLCVIYVAQRALLYFPPQDYLSPAQMGLPQMEEVQLTLDDGGVVTGWWSPPSREGASVVMVFHGNGSAVYSNVDIFADLMAAGHGVWSVGYPGYPGSDGTPAQPAMVEAALAQRAAVLSRTDAPLVYYGTSLGSGVAAQLARQHPPEKLFVDAPFNSVLDMAKDQMPIFPVGLLLKDKFQSDAALAGLDVPLYWTHGTQDAVVPLAQGRKLFEGYDGPKESLVIEGGQHTNLWGLGGRAFTLENL